MQINLISCIGGALLGTAVDSFRFFEGYSIGPLWFLLAMFWCRLSYSFIDFVSTNNYIKGIISCLLSVFAVILSSMIYLPTDILQGLNALPYFFMGVFFRKSDFLESNIAPKELYSLLLFCFVVLFLSVYLGSLEMSINKYSCYPINLLGSFCAFFIIYRFSSAIKNTRIADQLKILGTISILILSIHTIDANLKLYNVLFASFRQSNIVVYAFGVLTWRIIFAIVLSLAVLRFPFIKRVFNLKI